MADWQLSSRTQDRPSAFWLPLYYASDNTASTTSADTYMVVLATPTVMVLKQYSVLREPTSTYTVSTSTLELSVLVLGTSTTGTQINSTYTDLPYTTPHPLTLIIWGHYSLIPSQSGVTCWTVDGVTPLVHIFILLFFMPFCHQFSLQLHRAAYHYMA